MQTVIPFWKMKSDSPWASPKIIKKIDKTKTIGKTIFLILRTFQYPFLKQLPFACHNALFPFGFHPCLQR